MDYGSWLPFFLPLEYSTRLTGQSLLFFSSLRSRPLIFIFSLPTVRGLGHLILFLCLPPHTYASRDVEGVGGVLYR